MKKTDFTKRLDKPSMEKAIIDLRRKGYSRESVVNTLTHSIESINTSDMLIYAKEIELAISDFQSSKEVDRIIASELCKLPDSDKYFLYDPETKERNVISPSTLNSLFYPEYIYKKQKIVAEIYDPHTPNVFTNVGNRETYNVYKPADWYSPYFYSKTIPAVTPMPEIYQDFFNHLVNGDKESYDYLLKWICNSIKSRNYTFLCTVGAGGIGKGMLYTLIGSLHGKGNFNAMEGKDFFNSTFNSSLDNKTLFYINELTKLGPAEESRLKVMVEEELNVEAKYVAKKQVKNHINLMVSSNDMSCLTMSAEERRLSFIELTKTRILEVHWKGVFEAKNKQMTDPKNIEALGKHLLSCVEIDPEQMKVPFKSKKQISEIKKLSIADWQDYFLFTFCQDNAGQTLSINHINSRMKESLDSNKVEITRNKLRALKEQYPGFWVEVNMPGPDGRSGSTGCKFNTLDKQPTKEQLNLEADGT